MTITDKFTFSILIILMISGCATGTKEKVKSVTQSKPNKSLKNINIPFEKFQLENGLTVLLIPNKKVPLFSYYTLFRVGSKGEKKGMTGSTHFLEHLLFKGTKNYSLAQFRDIVEGNGGFFNAYTTMDSTVYYENMPSAQLDKVMDMEVDRFMNASIEKVAFERERFVILEERKGRYENSDYGKLILAITKNLYRGTPYGGSTIGEISDIKSVTRDQIYSYYKANYIPKNAVLVIAGDIDVESVKKMIVEKYSKIPAQAQNISEDYKLKVLPKVFSDNAKYGRWVKLNGQAKTPIFALAFRAPEIQQRSAYVADLLAVILGGGDSSYLSQEYANNRRPLVSSIYSHNTTMVHAGRFIVAGQLLPRVNLAKFKSRLMKSLKKSCQVAITPRNLQKAKNQFWVSYYDQLQGNAAIASFLGTKELLYRDPYYFQKEIEFYESISLEEVKGYCSQLTSGNKSIFFSIWNKHKKG